MALCFKFKFMTIRILAVPQYSLISMWFFVAMWSSTCSFQELWDSTFQQGWHWTWVWLMLMQLLYWARSKTGKIMNDSDRVGQWISQWVPRPAAGSSISPGSIRNAHSCSPSPQITWEKLCRWAPQSVLHQAPEGYGVLRWAQGWEPPELYPRSAYKHHGHEIGTQIYWSHCYSELTVVFKDPHVCLTVFLIPNWSHHLGSVQRCWACWWIQTYQSTVAWYCVLWAIEREILKSNFDSICFSPKIRPCCTFIVKNRLE